MHPKTVELSVGIWKMAKKHDRPFYDKVISTIPAERMGRPDEIGKVAAFFVSPVPVGLLEPVYLLMEGSVNQMYKESIIQISYKGEDT
ncbi:MAG: hypothetical protein ACI9OS_001907 [Ulvibacter sp.]